MQERTKRKCITTQIEIQISERPEDVFCLWIPESVFADFGDSLWLNSDPLQSEQDFRPLQISGQAWDYENERCRLNVNILPRESTVDLLCFVENRTDEPMQNVYVQNCLHFPKAPSFSSVRGESVFFCRNETWIPMSSTQHWFDSEENTLTNTTKFCYRTATLQQGRYSSDKGSRNADPERSDHCLIVKEARDSEFSVGIAGENWDFVFHNTDPQLGCIHSQPLPAMVMPGEAVTFKERLYFCDGDHRAVIHEFEHSIRSESRQSGEVADKPSGDNVQ